MAITYELSDRIANRWIRQFPGEVVTIEADRPIVSFTFDDVPDTALRNGARILEQYDARGTFYIAGGLAGRVEADRVLIDAAGCHELASRGHEIGCHTFAHRKVGQMGRAIGADLERNADYLRAADAGPAARNFAFPYALAAPGPQRELRQRFRSCRGGHTAINRGVVDRHYLNAVEIRSDIDLSTLLGWIDDVVRQPGWLIFYTHDVTDTPTPWGCLPATLDRLLAHASSSGCEVLTVDAALDRLDVDDHRDGRTS